MNGTSAFAPHPKPCVDGAARGPLDAIEQHLGAIASLPAQRFARPQDEDEVFARLEAEADARYR